MNEDNSSLLIALRAIQNEAMMTERARCLNILSAVAVIHNVEPGMLALAIIEDAARTIRGADDALIDIGARG